MHAGVVQKKRRNDLMERRFVMTDKSGREEEVCLSNEQMARISRAMHKSGLIEIEYDHYHGCQVSTVTMKGCMFFTALHSMIVPTEIQS